MWRAHEVCGLSLWRAHEVCGLSLWRAHKVCGLSLWRAHKVCGLSLWRAHHVCGLTVWRVQVVLLCAADDVAGVVSTAVDLQTRIRPPQLPIPRAVVPARMENV